MKVKVAGSSLPTAVCLTHLAALYWPRPPPLGNNVHCYFINKREVKDREQETRSQTKGVIYCRNYSPK